MCLTHRCLKKYPPFCQNHFQMHIYFQGSDWQISIISDNGFRQFDVGSTMPYGVTRPQWVNKLRTKQNCHHFAHDIFNCIFLNENVWISLKISLKFIPKFRINNIPALVQIKASRLVGAKPMTVSLPTHYASLALSELMTAMQYICTAVYASYDIVVTVKTGHLQPSWPRS